MIDLALILPFLGPGAKVLGTVVELFRGRKVPRDEIERTVQSTVRDELQRTPAYANTPAPRRSVIETALIAVVVLAVLKADQWSDLRIGQTADGLQFGARRGPAPSDQQLIAVLLQTIQANPSQTGVDGQPPYGAPALDGPGHRQEPYASATGDGPGYEGHPPVGGYGYPAPPYADPYVESGYPADPYASTAADRSGDPYSVAEEAVQVFQQDPYPSGPQWTEAAGETHQEPPQYGSQASDELVARHNQVMELVETRPLAAARMMKVILEEMTATLGPDHETTVIAHTNYAFILGSSGRHAESVREYEKALPSIAQALGGDHTTTVLAWMNYGLQLIGDGDSSAAVETFTAILPALETAFGADDERVAGIRQFVAAAREPEA